MTAKKNFWELKEQVKNILNVSHSLNNFTVFCCVHFLFITVPFHNVGMFH
jgi:hypothetical protein